MIDWWKTRVFAAATLVVVGCSGSTDVSTVSLTGDWAAAPNLLGIATIDVTLAESGGTVTGNGTYIGVTGVLANGTLTATGIHIAAEVNVTIHFVPEGGAAREQNLTGHVEDNDHFVLIFPGDEAKPVTFTRQ